MRLLNVGCGKRLHPAWTNVDMAATAPGVIVCNITKGLPFPDASFDGVYHSHLLEHVRREEALPLLKECRRVLAKGGTLRVVVPDLERAARTYLATLDQAPARHEWAVIQLIDQMVREKGGGAMAEFLRRDPVPEKEFVIEQLGEEARAIIESNHGKKATKAPSLQLRIYRLVRNIPRAIRRIVLGRDGMRAYDIGRFALGGEVHRWMYDRVTLARLLEDAGFHKPVVRSATDSAIPQWTGYNLDTLPDGTVIKPDSLFMEATA